jgi:hypothetical protein
MRSTVTKFVVPTLLALLTVGLSFTAGRIGMASATQPNNSIVGAWEVNAQAPYVQHLFTFNSDGTMLRTNPTDVQVNSSNTNDSVGMGTWQEVKHGNTSYVEGTFEELNAFADTHQPASTLYVNFKVTLSGDGTTFDGPASATVGGQTFASHLTGVHRGLYARLVYLWYGCPAAMVLARYKLSSSITMAKSCGKVRREKLQAKSAAWITAVGNPSGPPMIQHTSLASTARLSKNVASSGLDSCAPSTARATL